MDYKLLSDNDDYCDETEESEHWTGTGRRGYRNTNIHRYVAVFPNKKLSSSAVGGDEEGGPNRAGMGRRQSVWQTVNNKKAFLVAVSIGVILMILVISASVYVSHSPMGIAEKYSASDKNESVHLLDILTGKFGAKSFNGSWAGDDQIQYFTPYGDFVLYNVTDKTIEVVISAQVFVEQLKKRPYQCTLSADRKFVLVSYDSQKIYRHSFYAYYDIFERQTGLFHEVATNTPDDRYLQLAVWSPTGNALAFVHKNDIYYKSSPLQGSKRITRNGNYTLYNGVTDWVYEEEMFSSHVAMWFSPNSKYLAFVSFDDADVDLIQFPLYGDPGHPFQYPMLESIPYPKSGRPNPTVTVNTVNLEEAFMMPVPLILPGLPIEFYVSNVIWSKDNEVAVTTMNRHQNQSQTHLCEINSVCQEFFKLSQTKGWIDTSPFFVSKDGNRFLTITSQKQDKYSYKHIEMFDRNSVSRPVTRGDFVVESISGWDQALKTIYFVGTYYENEESDPSQTHLYSVGEDGKNMKCITCSIRNTYNESCSVNSAEYSKNFRHLAHVCSGPNVPETVIRDVENLEVSKKWTENNELRNKLMFVGLPIIKNYTVPVGGGFYAKVRLNLPPDFDSTKKYPLLIDVYGGPGSQKIVSRFSIDWGTSLVTSKNIIYGSIDGRGSGRRSDDLLFTIYRRLGTDEVEDQITAAKWLIENTGFIDANKTAIWGWSYGGFATAMVMGKDFEGIYKCGISVAPVTSWTFYDTIYTERYMGLPIEEDNLVGYNNSDVVNHIENFRKKNYYLIHGNADDNVHYQQSMILSRALEKADILFRQQSYPDENHGLGGVRRHLYHSLESFLFTECFH